MTTIRTKWVLLPILAILFTSCKTQEQIEREQLVNSMSVQMVDNQKLTADVGVRLQSLEERLSGLTGNIEETEHQKKEATNKKFEDFESRLTVIEETNKNNAQQLTAIQSKLKEQEKFISKVLKTLENLSGKKTKKAKKRSAYNQAMHDYKSGRYTKAKAQFAKLLKKKSIKGSKRARVLHNIGMSEYILKNNENAIVYFSKLYTEYPKSGYNGNGLLHLAKTFKRLKQNDQAKQTLNELIGSFPKSKSLGKAKKLLKTL